MDKKLSFKELIHSYRFKLILAILLPILLLISISSVYISMTVNRILQENFEKDIGLYVNQIQSNFSNQLSTLYNLNMLMVSNKDITTMLREPMPPNGSYENAYQRIFIEEIMENSAIVTTYSMATVNSPSMVERFYLFRDSANVYKAVFKNLGAYEQDRDRLFQQLFIRRRSIGSTEQIGMADGVLWYALDFSNPDTREVIGTLLYQLSTPSLMETPNSILNYEGAFWLLSADSGEVLLSSDNSPVLSEVAEETIDRYLTSHSHISQFGLTLSLYIPRVQISRLAAASTVTYLLILVLLSAAFLVICTVVVFRVTTPFQDLIRNTRRIEAGDLQAKLPEYHATEFQELSKVFNSMTEKIDYLVNDVYQKQLLIAESELKALQAQMNPHFMFNVLNGISIQAQMEGSLETSKMVYSLSQLLQAGIFQHGSEKVTIAQELEYVNFYLYLQNRRFSQKIDYSVNCTDQELLNYFIPKLTLQPVVENSVVHGLEPKYGQGHLAITIYSVRDSIYLDVLDDGVGFSPETLDLDATIQAAEPEPGHKKIGLANSYKIIRYFYGPAYGITIVSTPGGGCRVTLHIPKDKGGYYVPNRDSR